MHWNIILVLVLLHTRFIDCWELPKPIGRLIDKLFKIFGDDVVDSNECHDMCTRNFPKHDYMYCYLTCYEELDKKRRRRLEVQKEEERRLKEEKARRKFEQKKKEKEARKKLKAEKEAEKGTKRKNWLKWW